MLLGKVAKDRTHRKRNLRDASLYEIPREYRLGKHHEVRGALLPRHLGEDGTDAPEILGVIPFTWTNLCDYDVEM
jgi:hypothetical protein